MKTYYDWMDKDQHTLHNFMIELDKGYDLETGDGLYSFMELLKKYMQLKRPNRVLEWGPGLSTVMLARELPNSEIISIEHDVNWFRLWYAHFINRFENIHMYRLPLEGNYVEAPLAMGKFDLVFVDGEPNSRGKCLAVAAQVLDKNGIVIIHDAEREIYKPVIEEFFDVVDCDERKWKSKTVALELKKK